VSITADQSIVVVATEPEAKTGDSSGEEITRCAGQNYGRFLVKNHDFVIGWVREHQHHGGSEHRGGGGGAGGEDRR
jgi:hypothetical protein